jgi:plastocyanin
MKWVKTCLWVVLLCAVTASTVAQSTTVAGRVNLLRANDEMRTDNTGIVVWLTPIPNQPVPARRNVSSRSRIIQRNKRFETRVLAVQMGSVVDFPNMDPFFHNVFSLFEGKRFDLGLYEAKSSKSVTFDKAGVCYIFCNIHSQMSAVVVVVDTPYFVLLNTPGEFQIPQLPPGRYQLNVWAERCAPETLKAASRQVTVEGPSTSLGTIVLKESREVLEPHSNKYGKAYDPTVTNSTIYLQP